MAQFKIIDTVGSPPYRYVIQYKGDLIFGSLYRGLEKKMVGETIDYNLLHKRYDCFQVVNEFTGLIEYEEDVPF